MVFYAYFPVHAGVSGGGVQRVTELLLPRLADAGLAVTVVAPRGSDRDALPGVRVLAVLEQIDGEPFAADAWLRDAEHVRAAAEGADVVWSFDRPLPGRVGPPWLLTLHTLTYDRPLRALLGAAWDELVVPSRQLEAVAQAIAGPSAWSGPAPPPIRYVANGLDPTLRPAPPRAVAELRARLGLSRDARCLLFPHRSDPDKGLDVALAALRIVRAWDPSYRLLVPTQYELRLGAGVVAHPWVAGRDLAAYLSLGDRSLALSRLPEGFGLGPVEAIACGTPAIATRSGAQGDLLPDGHGLTYVARDDPLAVAEAILRPVDAAALRRGQTLIGRRYDLDAMAAAYGRLLIGVRARDARYRPEGADSPAFSALR